MSDAERWCRVVVTEPDGTQAITFIVIAPSLDDLGAVESLARLQLAAARLGRGVVVHDMSERLRALLSLAGLLGEVGRKPEEGKEVLNVEEEGESGDPAS
jgi:hypothetical protein